MHAAFFLSSVNGKMIKTIYIVLSLFFSSASFAATYATVDGVPVPWSIDLSGNGDHYYNPPRGDGWQRVTADNSYNKSLPYDVSSKSGQVVRVMAPVKIPVDVSKIGKAVATFAKRVGPVGTGLAIADLVCDLAEICKSTDGQTWQKSQGPAYTVVQSISYNCADHQPSDQGGASVFYPFGNGYKEHYRVPSSTYSCTGSSPLASGEGLIAFCTNAAVTCPNGEHRDELRQRSAASLPPTGSAVASDADWYASETALSAPQFIEYLDSAKESIPVSPPVVSPVTVDAGTEIVTRRNDQGTVTGTDEITNQITLTPSPTAAQPDRVSITQTTTTITKDSNNVTISSSTSSSTPPPAKTNDDPCLDHSDRVGCLDAGQVEETNLEKKDISVSITPVSVGGAGVCPSPTTFMIAGVQRQFIWDTYCNFATGIKPIMLVFAWLSAAGILIGGFKS